MKKKTVPGGLLGLIILITFFQGCAGTPKVSEKDKPPDVTRPEPFYEKDFSGEGSFIVVQRPEGGELGEDDEYLLDIIKGVLAEDIGKFSRIKIVDEAFPEDNLYTGRLYTLSGALTSVPNGYNLELGLSGAGTGEGEQSFRKHFTAGEIKGGALKAASLYCLAALGVRLTDAGRKALDAFAPSNAKSQVFLAAGKAAGEKGNLVEDMIYSYSALGLNPALKEASARLGAIAAEMSAGEENDVEHRNWWKTRMTEFEDYYRDHPPFDIIYTPRPAQPEFLIGLYPSGNMAIMQKVFKTISGGLDATGSRGKWGFGAWPHSAALFNGVKKYTIQAVLIDENDREINQADVDLYTQLALAEGAICYDSSQNVPVFFDGIKKETITGNMRIRIISAVNMNITAAGQMPPVKESTIPKNLRAIPQVQDSAARKKAANPPTETAPASPMDTRFGIIAGGLFSPIASIETTAAMASLEWGMKNFTLEVAALSIPKNLQSVSRPDDLVFGLGGGAGAAFVTDHLLAAFSAGVTATNLRDWGVVIIPYGHLRIDFLPWGRGLGLRLGFMAEAGSPGWGEAYSKYFDNEWTFPLSSFRINPRIMLGLGLWL